MQYLIEKVTALAIFQISATNFTILALKKKRKEISYYCTCKLVPVVYILVIQYL
jgi:hypothetical protein